MVALLIVAAFVLVLINNDIAVAPVTAIFDANLAAQYTQAVRLSVERAAADPHAANVIPILIIPTFHDGDVLPHLLRSIDVPVRQYFFIWNSDDAAVGYILRHLEANIPHGAVTYRQNVDNFGFSASVNLGLEYGRTRMKDVPWYFILNTDVEFPPGSLEQFARRINLDPKRHRVGMYYSTHIEHYAFAVTRGWDDGRELLPSVLRRHRLAVAHELARV